MNVSITPVPCFPTMATKLRVDNGSVTLGVGASFQWSLFDDNGVLVAGPGRSTLTDEQYEQWVGDDLFVVQCVAANLGLTLS